jgi:hypothetical protein
MSTNSDSEEIKTELLGTIRPAEATGNHIPDPARLQTPMDGSESIIRSFCSACGQYYELSDSGVRKLAETINLDLPASFDGYYFQVASCSQCDGNDLTVKINSINELFN